MEEEKYDDCRKWLIGGIGFGAYVVLALGLFYYWLLKRGYLDLFLIV